MKSIFLIAFFVSVQAAHQLHLSQVALLGKSVSEQLTQVNTNTAVVSNFDYLKCDGAERALAALSTNFAKEMKQAPKDALLCTNQKECNKLSTFMYNLKHNRHKLTHLAAEAKALCGSHSHSKHLKLAKKHIKKAKKLQHYAKKGHWGQYLHHLKTQIKKSGKASVIRKVIKGKATKLGSKISKHMKHKAHKLHKLNKKHGKHPHIKKLVKKAHKHAVIAHTHALQALHHMHKGHVKKAKKHLTHAIKHALKTHKAHHKAKQVIKYNKLKNALKKPEQVKKLASKIAKHTKHKLHKLITKHGQHPHIKKLLKQAHKHAGKARKHAVKALHQLAQGNAKKANKYLKKATKHVLKANKVHHKANKAAVHKKAVHKEKFPHVQKALIANGRRGNRITDAIKAKTAAINAAKAAGRAAVEARKTSVANSISPKHDGNPLRSHDANPLRSHGVYKRFRCNPRGKGRCSRWGWKGNGKDHNF